MKAGMLTASALMIMTIAVTLPNLVFAHILAGQNYAAVLPVTRGASVPTRDLVSAVDLALSRVDDLNKRILALESQRMEVRMSVLESRLETMFELGRLVLGAAVVYLAQVIGNSIRWVISKQGTQKA